MRDMFYQLNYELGVRCITQHWYTQCISCKTILIKLAIHAIVTMPVTHAPQHNGYMTTSTPSAAATQESNNAVCASAAPGRDSDHYIVDKRNQRFYNSRTGISVTFMELIWAVRKHGSDASHCAVAGNACARKDGTNQT